jgi:Holliday junction resolvasome RuvABC endonuclease subunit
VCACTEPPPIVAAGLDPAATSGWAVVEGQGDLLRLRAHGAVAIAKASDVERLVAEIAGAAPVLVVGIERPFVKPASRGGNPHSSLELAALFGRFSQAIEARGIETAPVLASTWQPKILGVGRWSDRAARKRAAVAWARGTFAADLTEDEADAAAIATWAVRRASNRPPGPEEKRTGSGAAGGQGSLWGGLP